MYINFNTISDLIKSLHDITKESWQSSDED